MLLRWPIRAEPSRAWRGRWRGRGGGLWWTGLQAGKDRDPSPSWGRVCLHGWDGSVQVWSIQINWLIANCSFHANFINVDVHTQKNRWHYLHSRTLHMSWVFWKCNFPITPPVHPSSVDRLVSRSSCRNFLKGRQVTLPCSYRNTCLYWNQSWRCHDCEIDFSAAWELNRHMRRRHATKRHNCGICNKRFATITDLYQHNLGRSKIDIPLYVVLFYLIDEMDKY